MARLLPLRRRRADEEGESAEPAAAPAPPPPPHSTPHPGRPPSRGVLRRERRALLRLRERRLRDLGGLMVEMYRRGIFREELLAEGCADVVGIEDRLADIEALLHPGRFPEHRCVCGARVLHGARFCPGCGRPLHTHAAEETVIEPPAEAS
jgi:hypothetical protein